MRLRSYRGVGLQPDDVDGARADGIRRRNRTGSRRRKPPRLPRKAASRRCTPTRSRPRRPTSPTAGPSMCARRPARWSPMYRPRRAPSPPPHRRAPQPPAALRPRPTKRSRRAPARSPRRQARAARARHPARYVDGLAAAPMGAPLAVQEIIWAGDQIIGLPYIYGGGHASFTRPATTARARSPSRCTVRACSPRPRTPPNSWPGARTGSAAG